MRRCAAGARRLAIVCVCLAVAGLGCSGSDQPSTAPARGKVLYGGKPIEGAGVTFTPTTGRPATGQTNAEGEFTLQTYGPNDGAVLGEHVVTIAKREKGGASGSDPGRLGPEDAPKKSLLPLKYSDPKQTPLKATVSKSENSFEFKLED